MTTGSARRTSWRARQKASGPVLRTPKAEQKGADAQQNARHAEQKGATAEQIAAALVQISATSEQKGAAAEKIAPRSEQKDSRAVLGTSKAEKITAMAVLRGAVPEQKGGRVVFRALKAVQKSKVPEQKGVIGTLGVLCFELRYVRFVYLSGLSNSGYAQRRISQQADDHVSFNFFSFLSLTLRYTISNLLYTILFFKSQQFIVRVPRETQQSCESWFCL